MLHRPPPVVLASGAAQRRGDPRPPQLQQGEGGGSSTRRGAAVLGLLLGALWAASLVKEQQLWSRSAAATFGDSDDPIDVVITWGGMGSGNDSSWRSAPSAEDDQQSR